MGDITIPNEFFEAMSKIKADGHFDNLAESEKVIIRSQTLVKVCTEPEKIDEFVVKVKEWIINKEK